MGELSHDATCGVVDVDQDGVIIVFSFVIGTVFVGLAAEIRRHVFLEEQRVGRFFTAFEVAKI